MWEQLRRVAKVNAAIVLFAAQPFTSALVMSNPRWFRHEWVWDKGKANNFPRCHREPMKIHESVVVFGARDVPYSPQMRPGEPYTRTPGKHPSSLPGKTTGRLPRPLGRMSDGSRYPVSILPFSHDRRVHPTQKPVDLMTYLVRTYTNPGETVLDFCMGSGTTGVACVQEGRDFIGIEREATYFAISQRRIATAQPALPLGEAAD